MIQKKLNPDQLIPTDMARKFKTIIDLIPLYVEGREDEIKPVFVIPFFKNPERYFICDGNHRAAAAYICKKPIRCNIITDESDLALLSEEGVSGIESLNDLRSITLEESKARHYFQNGWKEYLKDIAHYPIQFN